MVTLDSGGSTRVFGALHVESKLKVSRPDSMFDLTPSCIRSNLWSMREKTSAMA